MHGKSTDTVMVRKEPKMLMNAPKKGTLLARKSEKSESPVRTPRFFSAAPGVAASLGTPTKVSTPCATGSRVSANLAKGETSTSAVDTICKVPAGRFNCKPQLKMVNLAATKCLHECNVAAKALSTRQHALHNCSQACTGAETIVSSPKQQGKNQQS